jgi:hypothetical protein
MSYAKGLAFVTDLVFVLRKWKLWFSLLNFVQLYVGFPTFTFNNCLFFFVLIELYLFQQTLLIIFCQSNFSINIFYYLLVFLFST